MFTPTNKPTLSPDHLCQDCGGMLEVYRQAHTYGKFTDCATCNNKECSLWSVTLQVNDLMNLSPEQLSMYRTMSASLKTLVASMDKGANNHDLHLL